MARATPDGHTLLYATNSSLTAAPGLFKKLSYDPTKDFVPVSIGAVMHHGLAVGPLVPASVMT